MAVLEKVTRRIARYRPAALIGEAPYLDLGDSMFESAALLNFLHCLPGGMRHKCLVFDHIADHLSPGGRIFGCTLLAKGVRRSAAAMVLMSLLNRDGIFHNTDDSLEALNAELGSRFTNYRLTAHGSMAMFEVTV
jgi:hypothetical protein